MEVIDRKEILLNELIKKNKINRNFIQKFRRQYTIHLLKERQSCNQYTTLDCHEQQFQCIQNLARVRKLKINTQKTNNDQLISKSHVILPQSNRSQKKIINNRDHQNLIRSDNGIKQISLNYQNIPKKHIFIKLQEKAKCKFPVKKIGILTSPKNQYLIRHKQTLHLAKVSLQKPSFLSYLNNRDNYKSSKKKIAINLKNIEFDQDNAVKIIKKTIKNKQKQSHLPLINIQETRYEWNMRDKSYVNNRRESYKSDSSQKLVHVNSLLCLNQ